MGLGITSMLKGDRSLIGNYRCSRTWSRGTRGEFFSIRRVHIFIGNFGAETYLRRIVRFRCGHPFGTREIAVAFGFRFAAKAASNTRQHAIAAFLAVGVRILSEILTAYALSMHVTQTFAILRRLLRTELAIYILNTLTLDGRCSRYGMWSWFRHRDDTSSVQNRIANIFRSGTN